MSIDNKFYHQLEKSKNNHEKDLEKVLKQKIDLNLVPDTQFIYSAAFSVGEDSFTAFFPILPYRNDAGWRTKLIPLEQPVLLGSSLEGSIPTTIMTKKVKTGALSSSRLFLPFYPELVGESPQRGISKVIVNKLWDMANFQSTSRSWDSYKIDRNGIYQNRVGFSENPIVDRLNNDKELISMIQKIPTKYFFALSSDKTLTLTIDDGEDDTATLGLIVPMGKVTYVGLRFFALHGGLLSRPAIEKMVEIIQRTKEQIRNSVDSTEREGFITQSWIKVFINKQ
jgi:hypothetical protein